MPKGYWIVRIDVMRDPDRYSEYAKLAIPALREFGARFLVRSGSYREMEGNARQKNIIVEFSSFEQAIACYDSPEYQTALAIRKELADGELVIVEGYDDPAPKAAA